MSSKGRNEVISHEQKHIIHSTSSYDLSRRKNESDLALGDSQPDEFVEDHRNNTQEEEEEEINHERVALHPTKQTEEVLNTDDLLMDEELYIKSAQRYQLMKENQPHLLEQRPAINYEELMRPDARKLKLNDSEPCSSAHQAYLNSSSKGESSQLNVSD